MTRGLLNRSGWSLALIAVLAVTGCAAVPVGVTRADARTVGRQLTASALSGDEPSLFSRNELNRLTSRTASTRIPSRL